MPKSAAKKPWTVMVYVPKKEVSKLCATVEFAKGNAWAPFIQKYTGGLSKRPGRR